MSNNLIQILIPTMFKTLDEIKKLCSFWNLETDAIISVQCDKNDETTFFYDTHEIKVIFTDTRGVSKNRNILLRHLTSELGCFIDDDCSMISGYEHIINTFYKKTLFEAAYFNGLTTTGDRIFKGKDIKIKYFSQISFAGGPGIVISKVFLEKSKISFCEDLGTPNEIFCGEDSVFISDITKLSSNFYRCKSEIFSIVNDIDNSTYFKGYNEQYFQSKGAVNYLLYKKIYAIRFIYLSIRLFQITRNSPFYILKQLNKGKKKAKILFRNNK